MSHTKGKMSSSTRGLVEGPCVRRSSTTPTIHTRILETPICPHWWLKTHCVAVMYWGGLWVGADCEKQTGCVIRLNQGSSCPALPPLRQLTSRLKLALIWKQKGNHPFFFLLFGRNFILSIKMSCSTNNPIFFLFFSLWIKTTKGPLLLILFWSCFSFLFCLCGSGRIMSKLTCSGLFCTHSKTGKHHFAVSSANHVAHSYQISNNPVLLFHLAHMSSSTPRH